MSSKTISPRITVITSAYNCAAFIHETIESVLSQTYQDWEHIIVDDGSEDDTRSVVQGYCDDPRIHYHYQKNQGQSVGRNRALALAQGEYICFLDADDRFLPDKLEKSLAIFDAQPEVDILYGDYINIDENGDEVCRTNMRRYSGCITRQLLRDNCVSFNTTMVRRRCFEEMGNFNPAYRFAQDWDLWLRFSIRYNFYYLPDYLTCYRSRPNQVSSNLDRRLEANEVILRSFMQRYPGLLDKSETRNVWCYFFTRIGRAYASKGQLSVALKTYLRALLYNPWRQGPWRALAKLVLQRTG